MKLPIQQLGAHLTKTLAPIYLVSGDETLLVEETLDTIRQAALKAGFTERNRIQLDFFSGVQTLSLFASKQLLELDLTNVKLTAATSKILQEYAEKLNSDTILLIRIHKLDSKSEQSAWYKSLDKTGVMIPIWPINSDQLPTWILQRANKLNLKLEKSAAEFLAHQVEGNLLAAVQELEKLRLLQTTDTVDLKTLENTVADLAHFDIFNLVDSVMNGNVERSLRIFQSLIQEDTEPTLILWALARELRILAEMQKELQQGKNLPGLFSQFRIFEKRQSGIKKFLQRHSNCFPLLEKAAYIDRIIKGADTAENIHCVLEQLILSMTLTSIMAKQVMH